MSTAIGQVSIGPTFSVILGAVMLAVTSAAFAIFKVASLTIRQTRSPHGVFGRVATTYRTRHDRRRGRGRDRWTVRQTVRASCASRTTWPDRSSPKLTGRTRQQASPAPQVVRTFRRSERSSDLVDSPDSGASVQYTCSNEPDSRDR